MLLGEVASVSAVTAAIRPDLPPIDTECVAFEFEDGAVGTFAASYAVGVPWDTTWTSPAQKAPCASGAAK